jgi:saccharopine dehydrogenase-like NADP-dependent oxidoreductase
MTIHWCGTGLSSVPGLRRLIEAGRDVAVWNRTEEEAGAAVGDLTGRIAVMDPDALGAALAPGDVLVSMFPTDWHDRLAGLALARGAHFISSSYTTPAMRALDAAAREAGVAIVNEVGLDPGIDHLMAHRLMADYRASPAFRGDHTLSFLSVCGGMPRQPNAFRYKFSWSPLGVLKALRAPSRSIRGFTELAMTRPWEAVSRYAAPAPVSETFEVYPNRDSLPYLAEYGFEPSWRVKDFARGTLRLNGWSEAWVGVFDDLSRIGDDEAGLEALADRLLEGNAYAPGEADRVVLCVSLEAAREGRAVWHRTWVLDAWGDARGSAMARLVSGTVALAVEAVLDRAIPAGVHGAPSDPRLVQRWLAALDPLAQRMELVDHLGHA